MASVTGNSLCQYLISNCITLTRNRENFPLIISCLNKSITFQLVNCTIPASVLSRSTCRNSKVLSICRNPRTAIHSYYNYLPTRIFRCIHQKFYCIFC